MKNRIKHLALAIPMFAAVLTAQPGYAQGISIEGTIIDGKNGSPIPGLSVSVVHRVRGRSKVAITNSAGQFVLLGIPNSGPDPYYLEVYWGKTLKYRKKLEDLNAPTRIKLPTIQLGR